MGFVEECGFDLMVASVSTTVVVAVCPWGRKLSATGAVRISFRQAGLDVGFRRRRLRLAVASLSMGPAG